MAKSKYLKTLELLPDDIVLDIAGREILPRNPLRCLAGWALKASLERHVKPNPDYGSIGTYSGTPRLLAARYGDENGWCDIFFDITDPVYYVKIERAFVDRLMQVINRRDGSIKGGGQYAAR